jgi:pyruvate/2-oxoglutarate dehydrogenase complex dihydrolipoamide acyltransferase (E2) component
VPTVGRYGADENALMKAQTGAIGRTLAFAGMLVIPGTGVATAEDVQEAIAGGVSLSGDSGAPQAALPVSAPSEAAEAPETAAASEPRERVAELVGALQEFPDALKEVHAWAEERKIDLADIKDPQLRGAVRKLETVLEKARSTPETLPEA